FVFSNRVFYCFSSTGTFISAFTVLCGARSELISERGVCCVFWLNVAAALIQILTAVIMVGWIMSIFWGMDMVILAIFFFSAFVGAVAQFLGMSPPPPAAQYQTVSR
ncbi:Protein stum-like protein, partial [Nibea albiflora]